MSLAPGIYLIKNRATQHYIVPNDRTVSGDKVDTINLGDDVPLSAKISVNVDQFGLYSLVSASGLSIGDSGRKDGQGNRYLVWQEGLFKWSIQSASPGLFNIKLPTDPKYASDNKSIGNKVILVNDANASETRWVFTSSG